MKKIIIFLIIIILLVVCYFWFLGSRESFDNEIQKTPITQTREPINPLNISYVLDGEVFNLIDGRAENKYDDFFSTSVVTVFEQPVFADFDQDGDLDAGVWLVNESGGTGMFYYGALIIDEGGVAKATNTVFLGDRISPQRLDLKDNLAVFNFYTRGEDEPMSAEPSLEKSIWVRYDKSTGKII